MTISADTSRTTAPNVERLRLPERNGFPRADGAPAYPLNSDLPRRDIFGSDEADLHYWSSYIALGLAVLGIEAAVSMTYFLLTPKGLHRVVLIAIAASCALIALTNFVFVHAIARTSWRSKFVIACTLVGGASITLSITLDGAINSPLLPILALPMVYVALSLPPRTVRFFVVATVFELGFIIATDAHWTHEISEVALFVCALFGLSIFMIVWSIKRAHLESSEVVLRSEIETLAQTDVMTGCLNHGAFYERLEVEIHRAMRHNQPLSCLLVDLDLFKSMNDTYGHLAGDAVLATVGTILREQSRSFDVVGRIGGDEFAVVLPATRLIDATEIGDRLCRALDHPNGAPITASLGVAELCRAEPTASRLVHDADTCLYNSKTRGRGRVFASPADPSFTSPPSGYTGPQRATREADLKLRDAQIYTAKRLAVESRAILEAFEHSPSVGLGFLDRDFRILRINDALADVNGSLAKDQIGKTMETVVPELWQQLRQMILQVMQTGEPARNIAVSGEPPSDPGVVHSWSVDCYPVIVEGAVIGTAHVVIDVSDRVQNVSHNEERIESIESVLADLVDRRDPYTAEHQRRVATIAVALATDLHMRVDEIRPIDIAGRLHDLGKVIVPGEILARPGHLRESEMALIREHPQVGADMLRRAQFPEAVCEMVLQHHERLDGSGYPGGLLADEIPIGSRIIAVADVLDAMTRDRPYRPAIALDLVLKELHARSGTLYDTDVVASCMRLFGRGLPVSDKTSARPEETARPRA